MVLRAGKLITSRELVGNGCECISVYTSLINPLLCIDRDTLTSIEDQLSLDVINPAHGSLYHSMFSVNFSSAVPYLLSMIVTVEIRYSR